MRRGIITILLMIVSAGTLGAGLYFPVEPWDFAPHGGKVSSLSFDRFRIRLRECTTPPAALRQQYLAQAEELESRRRRLGTDELIKLGGYRYRLGQNDQAFAAWHDATLKDSRNFLAYSDLALILFVRGEIVNAVRVAGDSRDLQPKQIPGLTAEQSTWWSRADVMLVKLMRSRARELSQGIPPAQLAPDDLFGVQFVGEDGRYAAGWLAASEMARLPEDAIAVIQQLVLWMPGDSRLYWLLAELYNAHGDMASALAIMNECKDLRRFPSDQLTEHRRVIQDEVDRLQDEEALKRDREEQDQALRERNKKRIMYGVAVVGGMLILALIIWQVRIYARKLGWWKA
jgi:hypothetical protein